MFLFRCKLHPGNQILNPMHTVSGAHETANLSFGIAPMAAGSDKRFDSTFVRPLAQSHFADAKNPAGLTDS